MTLKFFPYKYCLKCLIAHTNPNSSNSFTEYFSSHEFKNPEAYAIATQILSMFCNTAAPSPNLLESQTTRVSRFWLKTFFGRLFLVRVLE